MAREMKNSGIEWIGKCPTYWNIIRGKYVLELLSKPIKEDDGVITCFRDGEVTLRSNRREDGFTMSDKEIGYQGVDIGDLVVHGMDGFAGSIGISDSRGKASPVLNVLNSEQDKKYIMYYLRSMAYNDVFTALATGIRVRSCDLRWNKLAELPYPVPTIQEQKRIANYLDKKCAEIDSLSSDIQSQISILEDYKKSVITEAVTKGLNPDVEMKDSGIEWIKEVPISWHRARIGYNSWIRARLGWKGLKAEEYVDSGYVFLSAFNIINNRLKWEGLNYINQERYDESPEIKLHVGDIVLVKDGAGIGKCARIDALPVGESTTNGSLAVISTYNCIDYRYLYYYLQSSIFQNYIFRIMNGMGVPHLSQEELRKIVIPMPPKNIQVEIADFLDEKCVEIDVMIEEKIKQIDVLEKYKKSLIYEYVTGKREVSDNNG